MKGFVVGIIFLLLGEGARAQVLCIKGYEQNDSISSGVNNLLFNGSFENGCPNYGNSRFCPNATFHACDLVNWSCTGGGTSTYASVKDSTLSIIPDASSVAYFGNYYSQICSPTPNDTTCLHDSAWVVTGVPSGYPINSADFGGITGVSLEQTVTGLIPSATYVLEFWAGGEAHSRWTKRSIFAVNVGFGNTFLRCKPTPPIIGIGYRYIVEFKAISTSHIIKFTNWGHACDSCTELILDDVRLYTLAQLSPSVPSCSTVSIDNLTAEDIVSVFPNPSQNNWQLEVDDNLIGGLAEVFDANGRVVFKSEIINHKSEISPGVSRGVYLLRISSSKSSVVKKLVRL